MDVVKLFHNGKKLSFPILNSPQLQSFPSYQVPKNYNEKEKKINAQLSSARLPIKIRLFERSGTWCLSFSLKDWRQMSQQPLIGPHVYENIDFSIRDVESYKD